MNEIHDKAEQIQAIAKGDNLCELDLERIVELAEQIKAMTKP